MRLCRCGGQLVLEHGPPDWAGAREPCEKVVAIDGVNHLCELRRCAKCASLINIIEPTRLSP